MTCLVTLSNRCQFAIESAHDARIGHETMKKIWEELEMKRNSSRQPLDTFIRQTIVQIFFIASDSGI